MKYNYIKYKDTRQADLQQKTLIMFYYDDNKQILHQSLIKWFLMIMSQ